MPTGYDVTISGLDWTLAAGTYTLGFSTGTLAGTFFNTAAIASGNGSSATIGIGALQVASSDSVDEGTYLLPGDHLAFTVIGQEVEDAAVPEPCSIASHWSVLASRALLPPAGSPGRLPKHSKRQTEPKKPISLKHQFFLSLSIMAT